MGKVGDFSTVVRRRRFGLAQFAARVGVSLSVPAQTLATPILFQPTTAESTPVGLLLDPPRTPDTYSQTAETTVASLDTLLRPSDRRILTADAAPPIAVPHLPSGFSSASGWPYY